MGSFAWQDEGSDWGGVRWLPYVIIGLISILLALLFGLFLIKTFFTPQHCGLPCPVGSGYLTETGYLKGMAFFLAGTVFFWLVGFRLISGRRAKTGGGLLSPMGYRLYGVLLAFMAMNFFFRSLGETSGLLISGTLSALCFMAAARRQRTPRPLPIQTQANE